MLRLDTRMRRRDAAQIFDKAYIVQARSGYVTAVNLHGVKDRHGSDFPGAPCLPFNRAEDGFVGIVLKLESQSVIVMMPGTSKTPGISQAVKTDDHAVNRNVCCFSKLHESIDLALQLGFCYIRG